VSIGTGKDLKTSRIGQERRREGRKQGQTDPTCPPGEAGKAKRAKNFAPQTMVSLEANEDSTHGNKI
jgi:hypothetical protein